jgi:hypothetical protein
MKVGIDYLAPAIVSKHPDALIGIVQFISSGEADFTLRNLREPLQ